RECKHSAKFLNALPAPTRVGLQDHFGIRMTDESRPHSFKLSTDVTEVVDLSVVDNPVAAGRIVHRLMAEWREIENRETAIAKSDFRSDIPGITDQDGTGIIRSSMRERACALFQNPLWDTRIVAHDTENSAHLMIHRTSILPRITGWGCAIPPLGLQPARRANKIGAYS